MSQPNLAEDLVEEQPTLEQPEAPAPEIPTQKQKPNVYTVMLIVSFICIVTACILLYGELTLWGDYPWWNTGEGIPPSTQ